jgi:SanA protein
VDEKTLGTPAVKRRGKKILRRAIMIFLAGLAVVVAFVAWANFAAVMAGSGRLYNDLAEVPDGRVGLVFGCGDRIGGRENLYFRYRIDAAAELWHAGKVTSLIVSGDNRTKYYNEPERMRRALVADGVPDDRIVGDFAGLRTLDSVVRAREIFGVEKVTFVSQRFQNERAAYLAKANGLDFVGYNARDVSGQGGLKTKLREIGARVKMWLDVRVLRTRPRHLGERETLPGGG